MVEGEEFMQNRTCARCDSYSNVRRLTLHWHCIARSSQYTLEERLHAGGGGEKEKKEKRKELHAGGGGGGSFVFDHRLEIERELEPPSMHEQA